jgi:hypothetical protein
VDTCPYRNPGRAQVGVPGLPQQVLGGANAFGRMVCAPEGKVQGDHLVADRLVEEGVAVDEHSGACPVEPLHEPCELTWPELFGQPC